MLMSNNFTFLFLVLFFSLKDLKCSSEFSTYFLENNKAITFKVVTALQNEGRGVCFFTALGNVHILVKYITPVNLDLQ